MAHGDGCLHWIHPLFTVYIGNYPKQILSMGCIGGWCPTSDVDCHKLRDDEECNNTQICDLGSVLGILDTFEQDPAGFLPVCSSAGIKPIINPYWKDFLYAHIFHSMALDLLHQVYQGTVKDIVSWIIHWQAIGADEVDARYCHLAPNHSLCSFTKGISTLSYVTGQDHNQMCQILLTLIIDMDCQTHISSGLSEHSWTPCFMLSTLSIQVKH